MFEAVVKINIKNKWPNIPKGILITHRKVLDKTRFVDE